MNATLVIVIAVALLFDFTHGFHDAANTIATPTAPRLPATFATCAHDAPNAIATSVSTRAISPRLAVLGAAALNFAGAFVSLKVAATGAKGVVDPGAIELKIVLAGVIGAIVWNLLTWFLGLPTSSSHALIGGVAGAAVAGVGFDVIQWHGLAHRVLIPSLAAPFLGLIGAGVIMFLLLWVIRKRAPGPVNRVFRKLQLVSSGFVAFTHGTNDAQKTMGVMTLALIAAHPGRAFSVPTWVILSAATAMALGTYAGGWRIIRTLGQPSAER